MFALIFRDVIFLNCSRGRGFSKSIAVNYTLTYIITTRENVNKCVSAAS